jgi:hypothetical protein
VFSPRAVVEIFLDQSGGKPAVLNLIHAGKPLHAEITLSYGEERRQLTASSSELPEFQKLRSLQLDIPALTAKELEIWTHQLTKDGQSEPISTLVRVHYNGLMEEFDLSSGQKRLILPYPQPASRLEVRFVNNISLF